MPNQNDPSGLKALAEHLKKLQEVSSVSLGDLFNPGFMVAHTNSPDFLSFCEAAGFKVESREDLEAIPDEPWDAFIHANTEFADWEDMQKSAMTTFFTQKMSTSLPR